MFFLECLVIADKPRQLFAPEFKSRSGQPRQPRRNSASPSDPAENSDLASVHNTATSSPDSASDPHPDQGLVRSHQLWQTVVNTGSGTLKSQNMHTRLQILKSEKQVALAIAVLKTRIFLLNLSLK